MNLDSLTHTSGEWLRGTGPESDIVMSSRIRLARNLAQFPFLNRADDSVRTEIERILRKQSWAASSTSMRASPDIPKNRTSQHGS